MKVLFFMIVSLSFQPSSLAASKCGTVNAIFNGVLGFLAPDCEQTPEELLSDCITRSMDQSNDTGLRIERRGYAETVCSNGYESCMNNLRAGGVRTVQTGLRICRAEKRESCMLGLIETYGNQSILTLERACVTCRDDMGCARAAGGAELSSSRVSTLCPFNKTTNERVRDDMRSVESRQEYINLAKQGLIEMRACPSRSLNPEQSTGSATDG